jgi:hypothetical protein
MRANGAAVIERAIQKLDSSIAAEDGPTHGFACGPVRSIETQSAVAQPPGASDTTACVVRRKRAVDELKDRSVGAVDRASTSASTRPPTAAVAAVESPAAVAAGSTIPA